MTMQRMKRGDLTRLHPRKAAHTDVYQPAPVAANVQPAKSGGGSEEVAKLHTQLAQLRTENKELRLLANTTEGTSALEAELGKAKEETAAAVTRFTKAEAKVVELEAREMPEAPEPAAPVDSVNLSTVQQVRSKGNTMRIDCTVEPTDGPLAETVAIYLTLEEGAKLRLEEPEAEPEEPEEEVKDDDDDDEDQ